MDDFWKNIEFGCRELDIPMGTFRIWKHRGQISRDHLVPLYQILRGTKHEVLLQYISSKRQDS